MNCNKLLADKWRHYQAELTKRRQASGEQPIFIEGKFSEPTLTVEGTILREMGITRPCCTIHFLTHRDLMDKI